MQVKIKVLDVKDGDAIIVHLKKSESQQLVILVDGGHSNDFDKTSHALDIYLEEAGKQGPDIIICTHYDADHIGGLEKIVLKYQTKIGQVWIHQPGIIDKVREFSLKALEVQNKGMREGTSDEIQDFVNAIDNAGLKLESALVLESYSQMRELVQLLNQYDIDHVEPFTGTKFTGWENEVKVIGPTPEFYNSLLDKLNDPKKLLLEETTALHAAAKTNLALLPIFNTATDPCGWLDNQPKDRITATNEASVILMICDGDKKYLFTGDASLRSFTNIPDHKSILKGIYWLKVAHHGSHNNSSSALIELMKPKFAFISGDRHLDDEVQLCLEAKGTTVSTTKVDGDLTFP